MTKEISVIPPEKELAEYKEKASTVQQAANNYAIATKGDFDAGADLLHQVKETKNFLTSRKEEITRPLMNALASVRDFFKPFESAYAEAEKTIKAKMLAYQVAEEERIEKEKERIAKRIDKGTMKAETAINKLENLGSANTAASGAVGKVTTRTLTKIRIINETLIPREYMSPNLPLITEAILRKGVEIQGVEKYTEKVIAGR